MALTTFITEASPQGFWIAIAIASIIAVVFFYLCFRFLYRYNLIEDTPTSKIRSAAQGYIELEGIADLLPGETIYAPLTREVCPWFEYKIEKRTTHYQNGRRHTQWDTIEQASSQAIFQLKDSTGICIIDPEGATVTPSVSKTWYGHSQHSIGLPAQTSQSSWFNSGNYRFSEQRIQPGDHLYALGAFKSSDGLSDLESNRQQVRDLLSEWKRDQAQLVQRFDQNSDGKISMQEWQDAKKQAQQEVDDTRQELSKQAQWHLLEKPQTLQQPFILSTVAQDKIIFHYRLYAGLSAISFLLTGAMITWALTTRF